MKSADDDGNWIGVAFRQTDRQTHRQTERHKDTDQVETSQPGRDKLTNRRTDGHRDRQRGTKTQTDSQAETY